jgi:hypothetical protein
VQLLLGDARLAALVALPQRVKLHLECVGWLEEGAELFETAAQVPTSTRPLVTTSFQSARLLQSSHREHSLFILRVASILEYNAVQEFAAVHCKNLGSPTCRVHLGRRRARAHGSGCPAERRDLL